MDDIEKRGLEEITDHQHYADIEGAKGEQQVSEIGKYIMAAAQLRATQLLHHKYPFLRHQDEQPTASELTEDLEEARDMAKALVESAIENFGRAQFHTNEAEIIASQVVSRD